MWISRKKYNELLTAANAALDSIQNMEKYPVLIGIERTGRVNKFTFVRNKTVHQIETMGLISDDLPGWKEKLLR